MTQTASTTTGAEIRLRGIRRLWGARAVLDGIDLHIAPGSFCVLLGPSGCGKTTCLRIIAGLDAASAGRVEIDGRDVTALPPAARGIAMVFQSYALFPHLTVMENIIYGLRARSVPAAERARRLDRAVSMLGIGDLLHRRPGQLSGGQQQRVALGRAIVAEARVCLMDEPLSNLDAQLRAEMRRDIHALQRRLGMTMLYVTHDQTEAMSMADQVVLLRAGRVEQDGSPQALYSTPANAFVASFIGTPPMNRLALLHGPAGWQIGGVAAPLGLAAPPALAGHGAHFLLGVRPEAWRLSDRGIAATVMEREYLGADTILRCRVGTETLLLRQPGRTDLAPGAQIWLGADPADLHLFDAVTTMRIPT